MRSSRVRVNKKPASAGAANDRIAPHRFRPDEPPGTVAMITTATAEITIRLANDLGVHGPDGEALGEFAIDDLTRGQIVIAGHPAAALGKIILGIIDEATAADGGGQ